MTTNYAYSDDVALAALLIAVLCVLLIPLVIRASNKSNGREAKGTIIDPHNGVLSEAPGYAWPCKE